MRLLTYIIGQGDSLEILAQQLLGDIEQMNTLIQINKLRYPYISDDPIDQFGNEKGTVLLVSDCVNEPFITINNLNNITILPNDTVFLSEGLSYASGIVRDFSGSIITFADPIAGAFSNSASVTIFTNQQNITMQVLRTGDTLLYPYSADENTSISDPHSFIFGTDWKLDNNGFLIRSNNDVATVTGIDNLVQALSMRMRTELSTLMLHKDYGNGIFSILGESTQSYFIGLVKYYAVECAMQDPRISDASVSDLKVQQDEIYLILNIFPVGSQTVISQPITIPIGGVR